MKRILVLGSGAREHALAWKLSLEPGVSHVVCAPGNPGIARTIANRPLNILDTEAVLRLIDRERIDLTVVGPEAPLAAGLADRLEAEGLAVFGPTRAAAQLESSKAFAKDFMRRHHVPTAHYRVCSSAEEAITAIRSGEFGDALVVKADGLAAGKGVIVASDRATAESAVNAAMVDKSFGEAGARVVLEEMLSGPEVSFFVVANGEQYVSLVSAQDHKRIFDDDLGPNTGGMGAFSPSPLMSAALQAQIETTIVQPVLSGMVAEGNSFRGFLYCGLMLTPDGPKVIEFNVRFGDPEAQAVLPLLPDGLAVLLLQSTLKNSAPPAALVSSAPSAALVSSAPSAALVSFEPQAPSPKPSRVSVAVVLAAHGYPGEVRLGDAIGGLDDVARDCPEVQVFFAGVKQQGSDLVTSGGRVLTVTAMADSYEIAVARAYEAAAKIRFAGMHYRKDIGRKAMLKVDS